MSVPICTIISWYGSPLSKPDEYAYCDGSQFSSATQPELYGYLIAANPALYVSPTQAKLPDLRGFFLRCYDTTAADGRPANVDPGRAIGNLQPDAFASHSHTSSDNVGVVPAWHGTYGANRDSQMVLKSLGGVAVAAFNTNPSGVGTDTRPKNIAVSFLIKMTVDGEEQPLNAIVESLSEDPHYPAEVLSALRKHVEGMAKGS